MHAVRESLAGEQRTAAVRTQSDAAKLGEQRQPSQRGTADQARHEPPGEHELRAESSRTAAVRAEQQQRERREKLPEPESEDDENLQARC